MTVPKQTELSRPVWHVGGQVVHWAGWCVCVASVFFAVSNKDSQPPYVIHFLVSIGVLTAVSTAYAICLFFRPRGETLRFRPYLGPYLIGAVSWAALLILLFVLSLFVD